MKKKKHDTAKDVPHSQPSEYEETEGATGAVKTPALPPVMERNEKRNSEENRSKGRSVGSRH